MTNPQIISVREIARKYKCSYDQCVVAWRKMREPITKYLDDYLEYNYMGDELSKVDALAEKFAEESDPIPEVEALSLSKTDWVRVCKRWMRFELYQVKKRAREEDEITAPPSKRQQQEQPGLSASAIAKQTMSTTASEVATASPLEAITEKGDRALQTTEQSLTSEAVQATNNTTVQTTPTDVSDFAVQTTNTDITDSAVQATLTGVSDSAEQTMNTDMVDAAV